MTKAGLQSIYLSGWQVAADCNMAGQTYPDQSLYPANSAAKLVERINNAFIRADQIAHMEGSDKHIDFFLPIVADCEAGFGGPLNAFELTKSMVRKGVLQSIFSKWTRMFFPTNVPSAKPIIQYTKLNFHILNSFLAFHFHPFIDGELAN